MSIVYLGNNSKFKKLADAFVSASKFTIDKKVLVLTDKEQQLQDGFDIYVVPYGMNVPETVNKVTYSLSNNKANVTVINIQNRPETKSFEILTDTSMGRVFINNKNKTAVEDVLICATAFYGLNMELSQILDVLNSILK